MNIYKTPVWENQPNIFTDKNRVLISLFPETIKVTKLVEPDKEEEVDETITWQVWVEKPLTRAKAINACEQEAYGLKTAMDVASFNASLARKARLGEDTDEVTEHDEFINKVKAELDRIGVR